MKVAILISGFPRFTKEFDHLLESLQNYDQVDWFFLFWKATHQDDVRIPPSWPTDIESVRNSIQQRLPERNHVVHLSIQEAPEYTPTIKYNTTPWSVDKNIWTMYYGIFAVNNIREQYELDQVPYDLVIRARGDVGIFESLDLRVIHQTLLQNPNVILTPANHRHGLGFSINDLFAIGLPATMSIYAQAYLHLDEYTQKGMLFHGETVLGYHLQQNRIQAPMTNFTCAMRYYKNDGTLRTPYDPDTVVNYGRRND